ncbi:MAG: hypothetical protein FWD66_06845 [Paludibacter sp.]|nr:hypothetical protein [Paludibacter sp.]
MSKQKERRESTLEIYDDIKMWIEKEKQARTKDVRPSGRDNVTNNGLEN